MIERKSAAEIETMARAGRVVADTLALLGEAVRSGMTTQDLDRVAEEYIRAQGGVPTFKGYRGFPASICTSPNSMVVHGIPGSYRIDDGDLLSVDVGVTLDGYVADSAYTFAVGEVPESSQRLLEAGQAALEAGIEQARAGNRIGDISAAIAAVAHGDGYSINTDFGGHGVGREMHGDPHVANDGKAGRGYPLRAGLVLALEPWFLQTTDELITDPDGWTLRSADGSRGAHSEHTVAITEEGPIVLSDRSWLGVR